MTPTSFTVVAASRLSFLYFIINNNGIIKAPPLNFLSDLLSPGRVPSTLLLPSSFAQVSPHQQFGFKRVEYCFFKRPSFLCDCRILCTIYAENTATSPPKIHFYSEQISFCLLSSSRLSAPRILMIPTIEHSRVQLDSFFWYERRRRYPLQCGSSVEHKIFNVVHTEELSNRKLMDI